MDFVGDNDHGNAEPLNSTYARWFKEYPLCFKNNTLEFFPEHDKGWNNLIEELLRKIETHLKDNPDLAFQIDQIKQKYGTLRFYISGGDDKIYDLVTEAEDKSCETCELCGQAAILHKAGNRWVQTLCRECGKRYEMLPLEKS